MKKTLNQMLKGYRNGYFPKAGDEQEFVDKHVIAKIKGLGDKSTEDDKLFQATNIKTAKREDEHGYDPDKSDEKVYEGKIDDYLEKKREKEESDADDLSKDVKPKQKKKLRQVAGSAYGGSKQKVEEAHSMVCKDCGCEMGNPKPGCDCKHDCSDASGSNWVANEQVTEKADPEKVAKVMREFKKGKLHSGSKKGPIVKDRKQAIAIALNQSVEYKSFTDFIKEGAAVTLHVKPHPDKKGHHVVVKSSDKSRFKVGEAVPSHEIEQGQDDGYLKVKHVEK